MTWLHNPIHTCQCDSCGKFIAHKEMLPDGGASWAHVPSSDISFEEDHVHCASCTEKYGMPVPMQAVRLDKCQGKY